MESNEREKSKNYKILLVVFLVVLAIVILGVVFSKTIFKDGISGTGSYEINSSQDNPIGVNIVADQNSATNLKSSTTVNLTTTFQINDDSKQYYYLWKTYNYGVLHYVSPCQKVTTNKKYTSLTMFGTRMGSFTIYNDSKCQNKVSTTNTGTYKCSNCKPKFTVVYNSNSGTGKMKSSTIVYGQSQSLRKNTFKKDNYYFMGWRIYNKSRDKWACYTNAAHTSQKYMSKSECSKYGFVLYKDGQKIAKTAQPGETVVFYAKWQYNFKKNLTSFTGFEKDPSSGSVKATVWPMISLKIYKNSNGSNYTNKKVPQGVALKVLDMTNKTNTKNSFVKIEYNGTVGWIDGEYVMINLPDVIPSIVYDITNANSSIFKNKTNNIKNITKKNLYGSNYSWYTYNPRLGYKQYIVPLRIPTAKKVQMAQTNAQKYGNKVKVYDAFRPWQAQKTIANAINQNWFTGKTYCVTSKFDSTKNSNGSTKCIQDYKGWYIALSLSSHNLAKAVDVTLVNSDDNQEIATQSLMHELSSMSVPTETQVNKYLGELSLNYLFTNSGFKYLISEWWHFEDVNRQSISGVENLGADTKANHLQLAK